MNTTEGNKLIAEFMDFPKGEPRFKLKTTPQRGKDFPYEPNLLPYHLSWDCLIPVVKKCLTISTDKDIDEWDALFDALSLLEIYTVWNRVIEFIQWYNK